MFSVANRSRTSRELVKAMAFLFDADEAYILPSCPFESFHKRVSSIVKRVDLATSKQKRWEASRLDEVDAAEWTFLVFLGNKVRIGEDVAHPLWKWEAALSFVFGRQGTARCVGSEVNSWIQRCYTRDTLRTELRTHDESKIAARREATKGDTVRVIDVWLEKDVIDDVLGIVTCSREGMFGCLAIVGIDVDAIGAELVEDM